MCVTCRQSTATMLHWILYSVLFRLCCCCSCCYCSRCTLTTYRKTFRNKSTTHSTHVDIYPQIAARLSELCNVIFCFKSRSIHIRYTTCIVALYFRKLCGHTSRYSGVCVCCACYISYHFILRISRVSSRKQIAVMRGYENLIGDSMSDFAFVVFWGLTSRGQVSWLAPYDI